MKILFAVFFREYRLLLRSPAEVLTPLLFFATVVLLLALAIGPEPVNLRAAFPGIIWISMLLSNLLSLDNLFREDFEDGSLAQWLLSPYPLGLLISTKIFTHWIFSGFSLILFSPILLIVFQVPFNILPEIVISLILGSPILILIGAVGSALTIGLRGGEILVSFIILPFYIPVLILASTALQMRMQGLYIDQYLLLLASLSILSIILLPYVIIAALKVSILG